MSNDEFDRELAAILDNGRITTPCWNCKAELERFTDIPWSHTSAVAGIRCIAKFKSKELRFAKNLQ